MTFWIYLKFLSNKHHVCETVNKKKKSLHNEAEYPFQTETEVSFNVLNFYMILSQKCF